MEENYIPIEREEFFASTLYFTKQTIKKYTWSIRYKQ